MPVEIKQSLVVRDAAGVEQTMAQAQIVSASNTVTVTCDGPDCNKDHGGPTTYQWNEQQAQQNADAIPDEAFRLLTLEDFTGRKLVFCKKKCVLRYLDQVYTPVRSPREQATNVVAFPGQA